MRIGIVGAGGVGGSLGGWLSLSGASVTVVARGEHGNAIQRAGLLIRSRDWGDFHAPVAIVNAIKELPEVDCVFVCVKRWSLEAAAAQLAAHRRFSGPVVPLLNGVDSVDVLASALDASRVIGGTALVNAHIESPGVVRVASPSRSISIAPLAAGQDVSGLVAKLRDAGVEAHVEHDCRAMLWEKFIGLVAASSVGALTRAPMGRVRQDAVLWRLARQVLDETVAVGRKSGVCIPDAVVEKRWEYLSNMPDEAMSSMAKDLIAGRPLELEWMAGHVLRTASALKLEVPATEICYRTIRLASASMGGAQTLERLGQRW